MVLDMVNNSYRLPLFCKPTLDGLSFEEAMYDDSPHLFPGIESAPKGYKTEGQYRKLSNLHNIEVQVDHDPYGLINQGYVEPEGDHMTYSNNAWVSASRMRRRLAHNAR